MSNPIPRQSYRSHQPIRYKQNFRGLAEGRDQSHQQRGDQELDQVVADDSVKHSDNYILQYMSRQALDGRTRESHGETQSNSEMLKEVTGMVGEILQHIDPQSLK